MNGKLSDFQEHQLVPSSAKGIGASEAQVPAVIARGIKSFTILTSSRGIPPFPAHLWPQTRERQPRRLALKRQSGILLV